MKKQEPYWGFKAADIPEVSDLPSGVLNGDEKAWSSLSPGYRRTIYQEAIKRLSPKVEQAPVSEDAERLARADTIHKQSEIQIAAREAL